MRKSVVVIGAGPAGLTAAWQLDKMGHTSTVLEADGVVGGIARTVNYKGFRFDIGGHRFFTKVKEVQQIWEEILGDQFLTRGRLSRIYYNGKFFDYPLKPLNALMGLGPIESARIGVSYGRAQLFPLPEERNLEQWVTNRFGSRLYEIFFKTYTEKVWGMPCTEIGADWAAQRIKNLDLKAAIKNAFLGSGTKNGEIITTLIDAFQYPRFGPGMMWEAAKSKLEDRGTSTVHGASVARIKHHGGRATSVVYREADGREREVGGDAVISSMPLQQLILALDPAPPDAVIAAARRLRYRDFLTVALIVDRAEVFPDNWIYIHSPDVKMGRIQNFKNWSPEMVPDPARTSLGLEYFVQEGDELWSSPDGALVELGRRECARLGLVEEREVGDGAVVRMPKAYPVYDGSYQEALAVLQGYLATFENLQTVGRNGLHRYNNQDHSMLTAVHAARNVDGERLDVWSVNVEQEYHEEVREKSKTAVAAGGGRAAPLPIEDRTLEGMMREAFALYDPVALGGAVAILAMVTIFVATAALLLAPRPPGYPLGPNLSLLGNYLFGFGVSWRGAAVGALEGGLVGFVFGFVTARLVNLVIGWTERGFWKELAFERTVHAEDEG